MIRRIVFESRLSVVISAAVLALIVFTNPVAAQRAKEKLRIANASLSVTALPLIAAKEWKLFE